MAKADDNFLLIPCQSDKGTKLRPLSNCYFEVENKPYRISTVFFTGDESKLKKELKNRENIELTGLNLDDPKTFSGISVPCTTDDGHSFVLIWLPVFDWSLDCLESLSHECIHATVMVMRMSGVKSKIFSAEADEVCDDEGLSYSQSSMFRAILSELSKRQSKLFKAKLSKKSKKQ